VQEQEFAPEPQPSKNEPHSELLHKKILHDPPRTSSKILRTSNCNLLRIEATQTLHSTIEHLGDSEKLEAEL
jgi:hypothetical protein